MGQFAPTAIPAKEAPGVETIQATADRGYFQGEDIAACEAAGSAAFVPKPLGRGAAASKGLFAKEARWEGEAVLEAMAARLAANPQMSRPRRNTVEPPFGTIKHAMNQGHFLMKGLRQARAEFSLSALAYNLLRVMNIVGVETLVEALRRRWRALARALRCTHDLEGWFYARVFARSARREQNFGGAGLLA